MRSDPGNEPVRDVMRLENDPGNEGKREPGNMNACSLVYSLVVSQLKLQNTPTWL